MFVVFRYLNVKMPSRLCRTKLIKHMSPKNSVLLLCDMQEKFRKTVTYFDEIVTVSKRLLQAARILDVPVIATEQYPQGLGHTVAELELDQYKVPVFTKTNFCMITDEVKAYLREYCSNASNFIICGIEAHICVYQTSVQVLDKNHQIHVVTDACSSRNLADRFMAFRSLEKMGADLTTCECVLFNLVKDASHPNFKEIQQLILEPSPDSANSSVSSDAGGNKCTAGDEVFFSYVKLVRSHFKLNSVRNEIQTKETVLEQSLEKIVENVKDHRQSQHDLSILCKKLEYAAEIAEFLRTQNSTFAKLGPKLSILDDFLEKLSSKIDLPSRIVRFRKTVDEIDLLTAEEEMLHVVNDLKSILPDKKDIPLSQL
uniref:Isochorismatase-like domain-containing protein n=1 Tax=Romanomermis culicivorax TaxID=13658 RepID=A0A915K0Y8_ROMCU